MPIALLALLSGIPALMVQVVWTREVTLLAGGQLDAIATVVASFFGGLALGARTLGGVADRTPRPLRLYALLEIASALLGLATFWGLRALESSTALGSTGMLLASAALLIPPTVALGGTQPALLRSTGREGADATRPAGLMIFTTNQPAARPTWLMIFTTNQPTTQTRSSDPLLSTHLRTP